MIRAANVALCALVACATPEQRPPVETARAYLEALSDRDVARMRACMTPDATVFEGGAQGTFDEYVRVHLRPELSRTQLLSLALGEPVQIGEGSLVVVTWPIRRATIETDTRVVRGDGAATFALVRTDTGWRIRHVHWSLRVHDDRNGMAG
jgi:ketosteroid isomerase-like protein